MRKFEISSDDTIVHTVVKGNEDSQLVIFVIGGEIYKGMKPYEDSVAFHKLEEKFLVVYYEQRGCGTSDYPVDAPISLLDMVNDIQSVVTFIKEMYPGKRYFLYGDKIGAMYGLLYLRYHAVEIEKMIVTSPVLFFEDKDFYTGFQIFLENYKEYIPYNFFDYFKDIDNNIKIKNVLDTPIIKEFIYSGFNALKSLRVLCSMKDFLFDISFKEDFRNMEIPFIMLCAKDDKEKYYSVIKKGYDQYANFFITYYTFDECVNIIQEQPETFVELITSYCLVE